MRLRRGVIVLLARFQGVGPGPKAALNMIAAASLAPVMVVSIIYEDEPSADAAVKAASTTSPRPRRWRYS
ncbi:MAG: hypothetical protein GY850_05260 [bacterium]|nr:hypothetical protein [bacterium]